MSVEATATPALPRFDIVFLDLDETLCSWMTPALAKHGKTLAGTISGWQWKPGDGRKVYEILGWEKSKFWAPLDEDPNFWHGLPKLPHCDLLVQLAQSIAPVVSVLSSPHQHENCYAGKHEWIKQFLPPEIGTVLTSEKHLLARPGRLLIDDQDNKVNEFRAAGGSAILIPQHWNSAHDKAPYGVLFYLAMELEKLRVEQGKASSDQSIGTQDTSDVPPEMLTMAEARSRCGFGKLDNSPLRQHDLDYLKRHNIVIVLEDSPDKFSHAESIRIAEPQWPLADSTPPAGYGPGTNTGHGHAWLRPDGEYAKCLGVKHCLECSRDLKHFYGDDAEIVKGAKPPRRIVAPSSPRALAGKFADAWKNSPIAFDPPLEVADSPIAVMLDAAGELDDDYAAGTNAVLREIQREQEIRDSELPATLLGYPVLPAETNSPLAQQIAELQPGDITFGPPLSANPADHF